MTKLRALGSNIIFKPIETKEEESGILMPTSTNKSNVGIVVSVGCGEKVLSQTPNGSSTTYIPLDFKVGDKIIYKPSDTTPVEDLLLINQRDILAVLE